MYNGFDITRGAHLLLDVLHTEAGWFGIYRNDRIVYEKVPNLYIGWRPITHLLDVSRAASPDEGRMTAPALARSDKDGERTYSWPPHTKNPEMVVPSVTTVIGKMAKPLLIKWSANEVAKFAVEHILSWQNLPPDAAIELLTGSPYRFSGKKKKLGTAIHAAIDTWLGGTPTVDADLLPFVGAAVSFMEDHVGEVIEHEQTIFNRTYAYAGTFDAIAILKDGRTAIVDWKSGKRLYGEVALQLSAYANGEFISNDENADTRALPPIDLGIAVHLPGDGTYTAREIELTPRLWRTFQALRTVQLWKDDFEADALGKSHKGPAGKKPTRSIEADLETLADAIGKGRRVAKK